MANKRMLMVGGFAAGILVALPALAYTYSTQVTIAQYQDASLNNNTGTLVIGDSGGSQVAIDNNEIVARTGSSAATLHLQSAGGDVALTRGGGGLEIGGPYIDLTSPSGALFYSDGTAAFGVGTSFVTYLPAVYSSYVEFDSDVYIYYADPVNGAHMCWNSTTKQVGQCASSRRFKTDIEELGWGLREVLAMKPVSFAWREGGRHDVGFIAEDAVPVVPELVVRDSAGNIESFNYAHYTAVLTRAVQEQQGTIESLRAEHDGVRTALAQRDREIAVLRGELKALREDVAQLARAVAKN